MRVLIIESDLAFAATLRQALEARGVAVETTSDGQQGMELAQSGPTAAVVLAVELGDRLTGGFNWCNKFKRDAELKSIPLLLTSSLATQQTFEQHSKLKTRADDYLLKPFGPNDLLERLAPFLPQPPAADPDEGTIDLAGELLAGLDDEPLAVAPSPKTDEEDDGGTYLDTDEDSSFGGAPGGASIFGAVGIDDELLVPDEGAAPGHVAHAKAGSSHEIAEDFDILAGDLLDELETVPAGPAIGTESPPVEDKTFTGDTPWNEAAPASSPVDDGRIAQVEERLATLLGELEASRDTAAELQAQLARAHTELAMTKGEATALQERLTSMETELADGHDREAVLARKLELEVHLRTELRALLTDALARLD